MGYPIPSDSTKNITNITKSDQRTEMQFVAHCQLEVDSGGASKRMGCSCGGRAERASAWLLLRPDGVGTANCALVADIHSFLVALDVSHDRRRRGVANPFVFLANYIGTVLALETTDREVTLR